MYSFFFFFNTPATTDISTLSLHDALPISSALLPRGRDQRPARDLLGRGDHPREGLSVHARSEEHTSELQSHSDLVCRLLLEKKKKDVRGTENHYSGERRKIDGCGRMRGRQ